MLMTIYAIDDCYRSVQRDLTMWGYKLVDMRPVFYQRNMKLIQTDCAWDLRRATIYEMRFEIEEDSYSQHKEEIESYLSLMKEPFHRLPRYSFCGKLVIVFIAALLFFTFFTLWLAFAHGGPMKNSLWAYTLYVISFGLLPDILIPTIVFFVALGIGILGTIVGIVVFSLLGKRKKKAYDEAIAFNEALREKKRQASRSKRF